MNPWCDSAVEKTYEEFVLCADEKIDEKNKQLMCCGVCSWWCGGNLTLIWSPKVDRVQDCSERERERGSEIVCEWKIEMCDCGGEWEASWSLYPKRRRWSWILLVFSSTACDRQSGQCHGPDSPHGRRWVVVTASAGIFVPATDLRLHATEDSSTHLLIQGVSFLFSFLREGWPTNDFL